MRHARAKARVSRRTTVLEVRRTGGRILGRMPKFIRRLAAIVVDHEQRIRALEARR
jgi:hypothetical protein